MVKKRHRGKNKKKRSKAERSGRHSRPSPSEAIVARHEDAKARLARREDPLARLLSRATETGTQEAEGFIQGVLTEKEHNELQRLLREARERYPSELTERVRDLRHLLERLNPLGVLTRFTATNVFGFWGDYFEPTSTGSEAKVEFVAGMLAASHPSASAPDPPDPGDIQKAIDLVDEIFDTSLLLNLAREATETGTAEAEVRFTARAQWLNIRGPAYPQHAQALAHAVFDRYSDNMRTQIGFDLKDLANLENAITTLMEERYNALLETAFQQAPAIAVAVKRTAEGQAHQGDPLPTDRELEQWGVMQVWDEELTSALTFDIEELMEYVPPFARETAEAILDRFTVEVGSLSPEEYSSPLDHNPISDRPFVRWNDRLLLPVPGIIARDYVRLLERDLLNSEKTFSRWRARVVDELAVGYVTTALPGAHAHQHLLYPVHEDGEEKWPEVDGLVFFDSVAIVIEGKSSPLSSAAQRGDVKRARADLRRAVTEAGQQAERVARYLRQHDPTIFYDENHNEIVRVETAAIERIHLVLPTLHSLADYGMNPARLTALGVPAGGDAWTVYLNDLRIISETVQNPAEFLHYLVWRSGLPLGERIHVVDEIDLFGSYLLRQQFPQLDDSPSTHIELTGSSTDFDDYYLGEYGHGPPRKRPRMLSIPLVTRFLKRLANERPPGWLSAAGTSLDLSLEELAGLGVLIPRLLKQVEAGEVVWHRLGSCLFVALGTGVRWPVAWNEFRGDRGGVKRVVFADRTKGKSRLVWALDV